MRSAVLVVSLLASAVHAGDTQGAWGSWQVRYQVTSLPSLGGTFSAGNSLNNLSWVAGASNLPGDGVRRATLWRYGSTLDLGTLGGPNSSVVWPVKNVRGLITGIAETDRVDPLGERWSCSAFFPSSTSRTCLGFAWQAGVMRPLPTLGGNNGFATGSNNLGQVAGWAENTVRDATCVAPQVLQFRAVVWGPLPGQLTQLPPLPGDSVSSATALNDRGQVVGISGSCDRAVGRFSARHAVLWENGTVRDLGTLGGVAWNTPMAINQQGDVAGFSNVSASDGGGFNARAFLWTRGGGIQDLGTLPGDALSQALGINERRQVVGISCSAGFASCRAFLWQDGVMTDLNALAERGSPHHLYTANDINDLGQITGEAIVRDTGASVAFTATPFLSSAEAAREAAAPGVPLSEEARQALLPRLGLRHEDLSP
jgi:probable HAF family extracellular repeat protein